MVIRWFKNLEKTLYETLGDNYEGGDTEWDLDVGYLEGLLSRVPDEFERANLKRRFVEYVELSKKRPIDRSPFFSEFKIAISDIALTLPDISNELRVKFDLPEYEFIIPGSLTEEELLARKEATEQKKGKKEKKKKGKERTPEEEQENINNFREEFAGAIAAKNLPAFDNFEIKGRYSAVEQ